MVSVRLTAVSTAVGTVRNLCSAHVVGTVAGYVFRLGLGVSRNHRGVRTDWRARLTGPASEPANVASQEARSPRTEPARGTATGLPELQWGPSKEMLLGLHGCSR